MKSFWSKLINSNRFIAKYLFTSMFHDSTFRKRHQHKISYIVSISDSDDEENDDINFLCYDKSTRVGLSFPVDESNTKYSHWLKSGKKNSKFSRA